MCFNAEGDIETAVYAREPLPLTNVKSTSAIFAAGREFLTGFQCNLDNVQNFHYVWDGSQDDFGINLGDDLQDDLGIHSGMIIQMILG